MNRELVSRLYHTSVANTIASGSADDAPAKAWSWEEEFTKAIVLECSRVAKLAVGDNKVCDAIEHHFGINL